jgi:hypothetical protein
MTYAGERTGCSRSDQWEVCVTPIKLSDSELDSVLAAARPIAIERRDAFLQQVAAELQGREVGPGIVHRICAEQQRQFFDPPNLGQARDQSKYR